MYRTLQDLTTLVERELAQYPGAGVQLYAEPIIQQFIQQAFDFCFSAEYWPQFRVRELRTLDGITGLVTVPFSSIKQWDDVQFVMRRYSDRPIPEIPNAFTTMDIVGTQIQFIEARADTNLFTAYPLSATDDIEVIGRNRPANLFISTDIVPFDDWALCHYASWAYLVNDQSNDAATTKEQGLFDARMKVLKEQSGKGIVYLNPRSTVDVPQRWY